MQSKWHDTSAYRMEKMLSRSSKFERIADYANSYPCLKEPLGYTLLEDDFNQLYGSRENALYFTLQQCREKIIGMIGNNSSSYPASVIQEANDLINRVGDNCNNRNTLAIVLLPYVIDPPGPNKKKGKRCLWKPSRAEQQDGFLCQVDSTVNLSQLIEERRLKLSKLGRTFQPWIVYVGDFLNPEKVFIVYDDICYEVGSILRGGVGYVS